jgi:predicted RNA-binding protein YlqC (UPF0109 family)
MPESLERHSAQSVTPDYVGLVRFLVHPFLELPDALKVDCETSHGRTRIWVRLAFESSDKGRVFGRGGRNIQAIRTILESAARAAGSSAHLDIYGSASQSRTGDSEQQAPISDKSPPRRVSGSKDSPKLRSQ